MFINSNGINAKRRNEMFESAKFMIYGKVTGKESGKPLAGLTVEALDKDLLLDDRLGSATTNEDGIFRIIYDKDDFKDEFLERKPDIYLRIVNKHGKAIYTTENKVRYGAERVEKFNIKIPEELLDDWEIEIERIQFKQVTEINPNYFGDAVDKKIKAEFKPVLPMSGNTKYEELVCVGLYPERDLLEAVIELKLPYGYKGNLCSPGSKEYVSFYIDYNDGAGFVSAGSPAEVNVHNLDFIYEGRVYYAVSKPFRPKQYLYCKEPQIVKIRAILSWEKTPTGPSYSPIWGNVLERWVQIKPKEKFFIGPVDFHDIFAEVQITKPLPEEANEPPIGPIPPEEMVSVIGDKFAIKEFIDASIAAEEEAKKDDKIEKERSDFKSLIVENPNYFGSIEESEDSAKIAKAISLLPKKTADYLTAKFDLNPELFKPFKPFFLKTKYEEMKCVGLYPEGDQLEAVIEIKLPKGYNGDLCKYGSKEYVAFYIDWGDGAGYQHEATTNVRVHDIPFVEEKPLHYAVKAIIPNIESRLRLCTTENIVRVKAILSWNVDPTPFGHTYNPTWGNKLVRNIQIRPKSGASAKCLIEVVNDIHADDISQSGSNEGLAIKVSPSTNLTVPGVFDRPFGGIIACWGNVNISGAPYYRFQYSSDNGISWNPIKDPRKARNFMGFTITRTPDVNGWFSKSEYDADYANYPLVALVHWNSAGKNGVYKLKLELGDAFKNVITGQTDEITILLDNTGLELLEFGGTPTPFPAQGVVVKDDMGDYRKCGTFIGPENIRIFGNFRDDYFRYYRLKVFGGNISASGVEIDNGWYDPPGPDIDDKGIVGAAPGGLGKELHVLNLCTIAQSPNKVKCAYGIELAISDRSIVGGVSGYAFNTSHHWRDAFVTFDWDPDGCP